MKIVKYELLLCMSGCTVSPKLNCQNWPSNFRKSSLVTKKDMPQ